MSASDERQEKLLQEIREMGKFYRDNDRDANVRLFAADYDFLKGRGVIIEHSGTGVVDGVITVIRGEPRKRRRSSTPPPAAML